MLYIGMFFFSLAIVSGMLGFAGIGVAPDRIALLVFFSSLLVASITFAMCLLRTAARASDEDHGSGGWHGAEGSAAASGAVCVTPPSGTWQFRSKSASRSLRLRRAVDDGRTIAGRLRVTAAASRMTGGISQEV